MPSLLEPVEPGGTRSMGADRPTDGLGDVEQSAIGITDAELTALALGTGVIASPAEDAVSIDVYLATEVGPLPSWYMPTPMARPSRGRGWRVPVVLVLVASFFIIEALGLCSTYGPLVTG